MFITAEFAVVDELIEALPATTWPLVGRAILGTGRMVLVCANELAHCSEIATPISKKIDFDEIRFKTCEVLAEIFAVFFQDSESKKCIICTVLAQIFWKYEKRFEFGC